jgi:hypothetical protein
MTIANVTVQVTVCQQRREGIILKWEVFRHVCLMTAITISSDYWLAMNYRWITGFTTHSQYCDEEFSTVK